MPPRPTSDHTPELVSLTELARRRGTTRQAVSFLSRDGGRLHAARRGRLIDARHPDVVEWLDELQPRGPEASTHRSDAPTDADHAAAMKAARRRKLEAEARRLELANAATEGKIISRELVRLHVVGLVDRTFKRLLGDSTKTIAARVTNNVRSNGSNEDSIRIVRDEISKQIVQIKVGVHRLFEEQSRLAAEIAAPPAPKKRKRRSR